VIENALADLKKAHESKDMAGIETAMNSLNAAWQSASQDLYNATQQTQQNPNPDGHAETTNADSEKGSVQDVDYEEVK
jgi:molecular chaperone DnaK